jgi:GNAT superfamily N-acetyltransferase
MQKQTWDDFGDILIALEETWPAVARHTMDPWTIRDGQGGGKRVSAATPNSYWTQADIQAAETAMQDLGQTPLFMVIDQDQDLDRALAGAGYDIVDPVNIYSTSVDTLTTERPPKVSMFSVWPPLAIEIDMWAEGGISDARFNVMKRVQGPKTSILARWNDNPAGVGFAAVHGKDAFVHAVEIRSTQRQRGVASWLMKQAAFWAAEQGASRLNVACTKANVAANALYRSIGMKVVGEYHYRMKG